MKRFGAFFSAVLVASIIVGCGDDGIKEGMPTEDDSGPIPKSMREMMEKDAAKMKMKGMSGPPAESKKAAAAAAAEKEKANP
jgi:hypothetical protein